MAWALPQGDLILVVPPPAHLTWPSLGAHLIQGAARAEGLTAHVAYLSAAFAAKIGPIPYAALANAPGDWMLGERLMAWRAWGGPAPEAAFSDLKLGDQRHGAGATTYLDHMTDSAGHEVGGWGYDWSHDELIRHAYALDAEIERLAEAIVQAGYRWVGATTSYDQTAPALAVLAAVKRRDPSIVTLLGGANCAGGMAEAMAQLSPAVDHIFSGEADNSFRTFVKQVASGARPPRVVPGTWVADLDALPRPDYADFLDQLRAFTPSILPSVWMAYESSRGCWWGEKRHCTFCGLNAEGMAYRAKSPDVVVADLQVLSRDAPTPYVAMTDNILPHGYHKTVVPRLATEVPGLHVFYEVKANLTLAQVKAMAEGGIRAIQPGIESLSTPVLRRMRKGVLARQNLGLLRYASVCGVLVKWNLLYGFPGDQEDEYTSMLAALPHLHHLAPPLAAVHLSIDRFSPYFDAPAAWGIRDLRPSGPLARLLPEGFDASALSYHFEGEWESASKDNRALRQALWDGVEAWRAAWNGKTPACRLTPQGPGRWLLLDSRGGDPRSALLSDAQARAALVGGPLAEVPQADWAIRRGLAVEMDGWCAPVCTAPYPVLAQAEARWSVSRGTDTASLPAGQSSL